MYDYAPIEKSSTKFTGSYNDKGYTISNSTIESTSTFKGMFGYLYNADIDRINFKVGEIRSEENDILMGNTAISYLKISNTAPALTAVTDQTMDENTELTLSLSDVIAYDVNDDNLTLVVEDGDN